MKNTDFKTYILKYIIIFALKENSPLDKMNYLACLYPFSSMIRILFIKDCLLMEESPGGDFYEKTLWSTR